MSDLTPLVEPVSIDEAFMDLSGTERLHGVPPAKTLASVSADRVERELGITVSIGLSCNKFLAKIASDLDKPRGFAVLARRRGGGVPGDAPGHADFRGRQGAQARFASDGIITVGDLQRLGEIELMRRYGAEGAAALSSRAWPRRAAGACRPRDQEHVRRNHVRYRHRRLPPAGAAAVAAVGKGVRAPQGQRPGRRDRHPQAQDRGFPHSHPRAIVRAADPARRAHLCRRPRSARTRDRRHEISPDRHRHVVADATPTPPISPTCSITAPPRPSTPSTGCARGSGRKPCSGA